MSIKDLLASLKRRWYLVIAGLVITAALAGLAFVAVPATYDAKASTLLLPPRSTVGTRGNPFLYLDGLNQALDVLSTRLNAAEVQQPIQKAHPDVTVEIGRDATTSGPILVIHVSGPDAQENLSVVADLLAQVPTTMAGLQNDLSVPDGSRITVMTLNSDREAEVSFKNKLRAVIALSGLGIVGSVVLTGFADAQLSSRRRRRERRGTDTGSEVGAPTEDDHRPAARSEDDLLTAGSRSRRR